MRMPALMLSALMMQGCSYLTPLQIRPPLIDPTLTVRCPDTMPKAANGTRGEILNTWREAVEQYHDCRLRHDGLVDSVEVLIK